MNTTSRVGAILVSLMFVFMVIPACSAASDTEMQSLEADAAVSNNPVVVFSSESNNSLKYDSLDTNVIEMKANNSLSEVKSGDIVILDDSWTAAKETSSLAVDIYQAVSKGAPVIISSDSTNLIDEVGKHLGSVSYIDDAQFYGVAYSETSGVKFNYSVGGFDSTEDALVEAYNWANTVLSSESTLTQTNGFDLSQLGDETLCQFSYNCGDFGVMSGSNLYYSLDDSSANYNYYLTHYRFQATPSPNHSIADMVVYGTPAAASPSGQTQQLYDYEPKAVAGGISIPIKLTAGLTDAGFNLGAEVLWTFNIPAVTHHDNSMIGSNIMDHWFEFDERQNAAYNAYMVEPGNVVKVSTGVDGAYHTTEEFRTTFCKVVVPGAWHNTFTEFTTTVHNTIYP